MAEGTRMRFAERIQAMQTPCGHYRVARRRRPSSVDGRQARYAGPLPEYRSSKWPMLNIAIATIRKPSICPRLIRSLSCAKMASNGITKPADCKIRAKVCIAQHVNTTAQIGKYIRNGSV